MFTSLVLIVWLWNVSFPVYTKHLTIYCIPIKWNIGKEKVKDKV